MLEALWIITLLLVIAAVAYKVVNPKVVIVFEYQKALRYWNGKYVKTLGPGRYTIRPSRTTIFHVDVRPEFVTIPGQEVLSADGVAIKISMAAEFQVIDPHLAVNLNRDFRGSLYLTLQMALREIVSKEKIDALMEDRAGIGERLMQAASAKATEMGLKLISVNVKDMMFPGELKKVFSQVVKAQKEGQAALEKARGETAALRSLANAARSIDDNPNLLNLRALQTIAESSGGTVVLGLPTAGVPIVHTAEKREERKKDD